MGTIVQEDQSATLTSLQIIQQVDLLDPTLLASIWRVLDCGTFLSTIKSKLVNKFQGKILGCVRNTAETALRRMAALDKKPNGQDTLIDLLDLF